MSEEIKTEREKKLEVVLALLVSQHYGLMGPDLRDFIDPVHEMALELLDGSSGSYNGRSFVVANKHVKWTND